VGQAQFSAVLSNRIHLGGSIQGAAPAYINPIKTQDELVTVDMPKQVGVRSAKRPRLWRCDIGGMIVIQAQLDSNRRYTWKEIAIRNAMPVSR
jgi:hypothetical protein